MAICMMFSPPREAYTQEAYDKIMEHLGEAFPHSRQSLHLKGKTEQGEIRIVDVFESAEAFEEFAASHVPALEQVGISLDDLRQYVSIFEVEREFR